MRGKVPLTFLALLAILGSLVPAALAQGPAPTTPPPVAPEKVEGEGEEALSSPAIEYRSGPLAFSYIYTDTPGLAIPDAGCPNYVAATINVPDSFFIGDLNVGVWIAHTYRGDLDMYLQGPDGTTVELYTDPDGSADNINVLFDESSPNAADSVNHNPPPPYYYVVWNPEGNLNDFNFKNAQGTWTFLVCDDASGDTGTLNTWTLFFQTGLILNPTSQSGSACRGSDVTYTFEVVNTTGVTQSFDLTYTSAWPVYGPSATPVMPANSTWSFTATVHIPWAANIGDSDTLIVTASGGGDSAQATVKTTSALGSGWQDYTNIPAGREVRAPSVVYYDGKLYVIGGYGYVGGSGAARPWLSIYDIATDSWTTGADMPAGRYWIDCEQLFDPLDNNKPKIYCAGGYLTSGTNTLYIYDIQNDSWSTGPTLPANRYDYASVKLGNKYYVIGGYTTTYEATMLVYDPATNLWSTLAPMNVARRYFHAGVIGGKIYVAGGYNGSYLSSAEVYDPVQNTWTYVASMPTPWLNGADGVKHDRFLVIAGGHPSSTAGASNGALVYDAQTDTWDWLPLLDHLIYGAEGDTDGDGDFWYATGRLYEGGIFLNSPYTTKLIQCGPCEPVSNADFTVWPPVPRHNRPAAFTGTADGSPTITYAWSFGDGEYGSGQVVQHTYVSTGTFTVVMTATNCDGANWAVVSRPVEVVAAPMIVVSPESLESTQCPDTQVTQTLSICNEGSADLVFTITEVPGILLGGRASGIESLSGSFVIFDPSVGGDTCYNTGASQTFCFRAESFTNDWEYVYDLWQKFPTDWTVNNVYVQGTPSCTGGGTWGTFSWSFETAPYEVDIYHPRYQASTDHCTAYYCFDVVAGTGVPNALVSWYWDGDGWGNPPHHPCSSDIYTPPSMAGEPCDEWFNPQAFIPPCGGPGPDIPWLSENPITGTVPPGQCQDVTVTFDSTGLAPDTYTGTLRIDNNDILNPVVNVPVTLTVAGPPTNVDFTWDPTFPTAGEEVSFQGSADALLPVEYAWDFGDGEVGSGQFVLHTYRNWGVYTVTMSATVCDFTVTATHRITVTSCQNLVEEHFEGDFPPSGWTVLNNGGNCVWQRNDQWSTPRPNYAGGQGYCADADSDRCGSGTTMDTELRTPAFDLSGATVATLRFMAAYNDIASGGDYADTDISTDGGATWVNLLHWDEDHSAYGPGEQVSVPLTPYLNSTNTLIRFHYYTATYDWWWEVDQVYVDACYAPPGCVPPDGSEFTWSPLTPLVGEEVTFTGTAGMGTGPLTYAWAFGDGGYGSGWRVTHAYTATGDYTVVLTVTNACGQAVVAHTVTVGTPPDIVVTPESLFAEQCPDTVTTQTLSICNTGDFPLTWSLRELTQTVQLAGWRPLERPTVYLPEAVADVAVPGEPAGAYTPASGATWSYPQAVLWDNGPLVTHPAACSGQDASRLQTSLGMTTLGFGHQFANGYRMSDQFTITDPLGWNIDTITFFAYQTGAPMSPSPITGVYLQIWDGPPWAGGSVVWGDLTTNRLLSSTFTNIQRDSETSPCANNRYIFADVAQVGTWLPPGTYWLDWTTDGNPSYSGPWAPPITILGQTTTGDAYQYTGAWAPALDGGTTTQQGMPFIIEGSVVQPVDVPWLSEEPITGTVPGGQCQDVTVTFDSTGMAPGTYTAGLLIESNDPDMPTLTVPVTLTVLEPLHDVDFTWTPPTPTVGEAVTFQATAFGTGPITYDWAFGDGGTASGITATHTYTAPGDYVVVLTVGNVCGQVVVTHTVTVVPPCVPPAGADFSWAPLEPVVGELVTFTGSVVSGTEPLTWEWDFGDGGSGTGNPATHIYGAPGDYTVVMTVSNVCGFEVVTYTVAVAGVCVPPAGADFSWAPPSPLAGEVVTFTGTVVTGTEPLSWAWAFGDGGTGSGNPTTHAYATAGTFTVTLMVTNTCGQALATHTVTVAPTCTAPAGADFSWAPLEPVVGELVHFTGTVASGTPPFTYAWAFGDGSTGSGPNPTHVYAAAGDYTVVMTVTNACGQATATYIIYVVEGCVPPAGADFSWAPPEPVVGELVHFTGTVASGTPPFTYEWAFGDGGTGSGPNPTHVYAAAGDYTVVMTVTNACGQDTATYIIHVAEGCVPPEGVDFTWAPTSPFVGEAAHFTATVIAGTPPFTYTWAFGDGGVGSGPFVAHTYAATGTYDVLLTVTNACGQATATHSIVVRPVVPTYYTVYLPLVLKGYTFP